MLKKQEHRELHDRVESNKYLYRMLIGVIINTIIFSVVIGGRAFAAQCGNAETVLIECGDVGSGNIVHVLSLILDIMTMGIGILAVIGISWFGIQYLTAGSDTTKTTKAKRRMLEITIGIVGYLAIFSTSKWLMPSGVTNPTDLEKSLAELTITVNGPKTIGETFTPKVTVQAPASELPPSEPQSLNQTTPTFTLAVATIDSGTTEESPTESTTTDSPSVTPSTTSPTNQSTAQSEYSLTTSDSSVISILGKHAKCTDVGKATITVVTSDKKQASTEVTCEDQPQTAQSVTPKQNKPAIRRASDGTATVGNMEKTRLKNGKPHLRTETLNIIKKHNRDFNYKNYKKIIKSKGGLIRYIQNLGGVFKAYGSRINKNGNIARVKVATAADLQAAFEFTYGLFMIWGPDYDSGQVHHDWKGKDAFYKGLSNRGAIRGYSNKKIQKMLQQQLNNTDDLRTSCNSALNTFNRSTTLEDMHGASHQPKKQLKMSIKNYPKNKGKITKWSDLRVGDIVHFFAANGSWRHVALVGEVYSDYIVLYDGGSKFVKNRQYKFAVKRANDKKIRNPYKMYSSWWGFRPWRIDQSVTLKGIN